MKLLSLAILLLSSLPALAQFGAQAVSAGRWEPRNYTNSLGLMLGFCTYWTNGMTLNGATVSAWTNRLGNGFDLAQGTEASQPVLSRSDNKANLLVQSEEFDATWVATRSSVDDQADAGPLGDGQADKLIEDGTASSSHYLSQPGLTQPAGTYVFTVWAKAAERTWIDLNIGNSTPLACSASFDLQNGVVGTEASSGTGASGADGEIIAGPVSGYYQCQLTGSFTEPITRWWIRLASADATVSYNGNGTSGVYLWGASLRPASCDSDYIATTATPAYPGLNGKPVLVFDGSNDSMAVACAAMVQPTSVYLLHNPTTWTLNDATFDGASGDASGKLYQSATTPNIRFSAGTAGTELVPPALGTWRVSSTVFDGDNSRLSTNAGPFTVSAGGAGNMAGFRLAANGAGSANWNGKVAGVIVTAGATNSTAATTYLQHGFLKMAGVK